LAAAFFADVALAFRVPVLALASRALAFLALRVRALRVRALTFLADFRAAPPFAAARRRAGADLRLAALRALFGRFTERVRAAFFALRFAAPRPAALRVDLLLAMANPFRLKSRVPTIYLDSSCPLA